MNHPTLTEPCELTYGPAFFVEPLRGHSSAPVVARLEGERTLVYTVPPAESEFDTHHVKFAKAEPDGPYLSFRDADGGLILTLEPIIEP